MNRIVRTAASVLVALGLAAGLAPPPAQTATVKASGWTVSTGCTAGTRVRLKVNAPSVTAAKSALTKTQRAKQAAAGYTSANRDGKTIYLYGVAMKTTKAVKIGKVTAPARGNCVLPANVKITGKIAPTAAQREMLVRNAPKIWRKDFPQWKVGYRKMAYPGDHDAMSWPIGSNGSLQELQTVLSPWQTGEYGLWVAAHEVGHAYPYAVLGFDRVHPWLYQKGMSDVERVADCVAEVLTGITKYSHCSTKERSVASWLVKAPLFHSAHPVSVPAVKAYRTEISGTPKVGSTLKVDTSGWAKDVKLSIVWSRNQNASSVLVASGTTTYKPTKADVGKTIYVRIVGETKGKMTATIRTQAVLIRS